MKKMRTIKTLILVICFIINTILASNTYAYNIDVSQKSIIRKDFVNILGDGRNCAVIICGGVFADPCKDSFKNDAEYAKKVFENKGWNVNYLFHPKMDELIETITNWIPANIGHEKQVFIYFTDHGSDEGFLFINPSSEWNKNERVYPNDLKEMLDKIENYYSICTVVIDACFAGKFIESLSEENRIIITSTDDDSGANSHPIDKTYGLFSRPFFEALNNNESYGGAWEIADEEVDSWDDFPKEVVKEQNPRIEDTGNGLAVGDDKQNTLPMLDEDGKEEGLLALENAPPIHEKKIKSMKIKNQFFKNFIFFFKIAEYKFKPYF